VSRRSAVIIVAVAAFALIAGTVVFWSRGDAGSTATFCASLNSGENPLDTFDRYDPSNADTAQLQRGVDRLEQIEKAAPKEIKDDVKVLVDTAQQIVKALDAAAKNQPVTDLDAAQVDQARAASVNVTRYATEHCGVTLDSGSSGPESTVPTTA
jgi:hypothetical protein